MRDAEYVPRTSDTEESKCPVCGDPFDGVSVMHKGQKWSFFEKEHLCVTVEEHAALIYRHEF